VRFRTKIDRARTELKAAPQWRRAFRLLAGASLVLLAFGTLVALNLLLRAGGLWGDLAFALIVTTAVLWALTWTTSHLLGRARDWRAFARALSATLVLLVGLPVALVTLPFGAVILLVPIALWLPLYFLRKRPAWLPPLWPVALAAVGLVVLFVLVRTPLTPADRVPRAVPRAQVDEANRELADRFRPFIFFDSAEQRYPLDVEDAIADGRVDMCSGGFSADDCEDVTEPAAIDESFDYLNVSDAPPPVRGGGPGSAVYYHGVRDGTRTYVDYWWFYSRNPSPVAGEVFCGPGLRTPPFTCQEHAGDWEGVTVVLEACATESETCVDVAGELVEPAAVRYAQHEHVVEYGWADTLLAVWRVLRPPTSAALAPVWEEAVLPAATDPGTHPLVFVARNSHASYPDVCFRGCRQEVRALAEARFDGGQPWTHNVEECDGCLKPLPLTSEGEPALWNAFPGRWGAQRCILGGAYCDLSGAPRGPSRQHRYDEPGAGGVRFCFLPPSGGGDPRLRRCPRG
jgi:hypothetical protein